MCDQLLLFRIFNTNSSLSISFFKLVLHDNSSSRSLIASDFSRSNTDFCSNAFYTCRITFHKLLHNHRIKHM